VPLLGSSAASTAARFRMAPAMASGPNPNLHVWRGGPLRRRRRMGLWLGRQPQRPGVFIPGVGTVQISNHSRWITTVAARFGYAIDQWLVYGKAGGGWVGNYNLTVTDLTTGVSVARGTVTNFTNCGNNTGGWLVGAGAEWAFAPHWSLKFEYDYLGLGNRTFTIPATAPLLAGDTFTSSNRNVQMVKVGVTYLWNLGYDRY